MPAQHNAPGDFSMDVNKTLIAMSIAAALSAAFLPSAANAKKADEEDSVYRWGRWAVLSPAAGVEEVPAFPAVAGNEVGRCEASANCPEPQEIDEEEEKPQVGQPVGFARIDYRTRGSSQAYDRYVGMIGLDDDGTDGSMAFQVAGPSAPDGDNVNLTSGSLPVVAVGPDRFRSTAAGSLSAISGQYTRGADGQVAIIEGIWRQVAADGAYNHSGEYVWGITATAAELAALDLGGDVVAHYFGATATGGTVELHMNLRGDAQGTWNGSVQGRVLSFDAAGTLENARFIANQFNSNLSASITGEMQGALVNAGNNAIGSFAVEADFGEGGVLREADVFNAGLGEGPPVN